MTANAAVPPVKLSKPPARRFLVFVLMVACWGQIWIGMQMVANYGTIIMADLGISNALLSVIGQGMSISLALMAFVSGFVGLKLGPKRTLMIGLAINVLAGVLFFFDPRNVPFLIVIRLIEGAGAGFINAYSVSLIGVWFPKKERGLAMGLQMGLYGVVISFAAILISGFNAMDMTWWQGLGTFVTVAPFICLVLVGLLYRDIDKVYGVGNIDEVLPEATNDGAATEEEESALSRSVGHQPTNYRQLMSCAPFWLAVLCICFQTCGSFNLAYSFPFLLPGWGYDGSETTSFLAMAFTGSLIFGPLGGVLSDRVFGGRRGPVIVINFVLTAIFLVAFLAAGVSHASLVLLLVLGWIAYGANSMGVGPMYAIPPEVVSPEFYPTANTLVVLCCNLVSVGNVILAGFLADATGSYLAGLVVTGCLLVLGIVCGAVLQKRYRA